MENIYDIRRLENLLFVLDSDRMSGTIEGLPYNKCAVFVNLYYFDTVERYMDYLNQIPNGINTYVYSSNTEVLTKARILQNRRNIFYQQKENRGRDISALLIAASQIIQKYDYVCFLHDKKANADYLEKDVNLWIDNLWSNTIGSKGYIYQVLNIFEQNKEIGLLVPPEAFGTYIAHWYGDTWLDDYPLCKALSEELNLNADITKDKMPFTIGTVFWARTQALRKLFEKQWNYEDFPEEPMPIDGTISHAIEKILGYVAQDAGYKTGTIMSDRYASWLLLSAQEHMRAMFRQMQKREHIFNMAQIFSLDDREKRIGDFCARYRHVYIYGAGNYGKSLYHFMKDRSWHIQGFVVSPQKRTVSTVEGQKVFEIQELEADDAAGILIGVSYEYREEVGKILNTHGFLNYIYGF